jgi:hypothetical protein
MKFRKLFHEGRTLDEESHDMEGLVVELRSRLPYMHDMKVDDIIEFMDALGRHWTNDGKVRKVAAESIRYLSGFLRRENLTSIADTELRDRNALDRFVAIKRKGTLYHAQPKGLVVHWVAGNVAILGFISVLQALLTKNVSLVKASSRTYGQFLTLLESFKAVRTENIDGGEIVKAISVVLVERDDRDNQEKLSMAADVRVAWGGQEAVEIIMGLRKRMTTEDIIYGPKYSFAVIGKECLNGGVRDAAYRLAIDISVFDQYSCTSPHTVFVEAGGRTDALGFAKELSRQMEMVGRKMLPKGPTDPNKSMDILSIRSRYEFTGEVFSPDSTEWTVIYSDEQGLADACFSRVIFVRPIDDIEKISKYVSRKIQTVGIELPEKRRRRFADAVTTPGIDRCPALGTMSFFESPWDGMFAMDRMVRWVTTYK